MSFHEIRFPLEIARGAQGGPRRRTQIVTAVSGHEQRNAQWATSRRDYNIGYGLRGLDDIHRVIVFFEERRGRLHGFRFKDFADFRSGPPMTAVTPLDQALGTGDGAMLAFPLHKTYGAGETAYQRRIDKPVAGTVRVAADGIELASGWSVDTSTGIITFDAAPGAGVALTAGFEFDVPVRFDTDHLSIDVAAFGAGAVPDVPLVEIRP